MGIVAIVGRPNVGKSTLFNRLVGMRQAIVDSTAGTTRDRHYGRTDWNGREFSVIDTGGYTVNGEDVFEEEIRRQVMLAIDEADVILFHDRGEYRYHRPRHVHGRHSAPCRQEGVSRGQ